MQSRQARSSWFRNLFTLPRKRPHDRRRNRMPHVIAASVQVLEDRTLLSPGLSTTIEGINLAQDSANQNPPPNTILGIAPPDPNGAVGPNYVVSTVNTSITWSLRDGSAPVSRRIGRDYNSSITGSFFEPLAPANALTDTKVMYDQYSGRFVVISLEVVDSGLNNNANNSSRILVAASTSGDPNGPWYYRAINARDTMVVGGQTYDYWADYPGLAIDSQAISVTANIARFGSKYIGDRPASLWIIDKIQLYNDFPTSINRFDPLTAAGLGGYKGFTTMPAQTFGTAPAGVGTYLTTFIGSDAVSDYMSVIRVSNPLSSPTFTNEWADLGNVHNNSAVFSGAPQLQDGTLISTNDSRMLGAAWRNNELYAVNTVIPPSGSDAGEETAHWYRVDTTTFPSYHFLTDDSNNPGHAMGEQGNVGAEDLGSHTRTFMGSIGADSAGNVAIGFAASNSSLYAGAYYTVHGAADAAGTVRSTSALAAGGAPYALGIQNGTARWGDYSSVAIDPTNDSTFWAFNEYSTVLSGSRDRWATRWGSFSINNAVDAAPALTLPSANAIFFSDRDAVTIDGAATVSDSDSANFGGGSLVASLTANATANDQFVIFVGGQITGAGSQISYNGNAIATYTGGIGTVPLRFALTANATPAAVQALVRSIGFRINNDHNPVGTRTARFQIENGHGAVPNVMTKPIEVGDVDVEYRLYNLNSPYGFHVFTVSAGERDSLMSLPGDHITTGYRDESTSGNGFSILANQVTGSVQIFRLYNPNNGEHYYTLNGGLPKEQGEVAFDIAHGYQLENPDTGMNGFMFLVQVAGTVPIYHVYNSSLNGSRVYTTNYDEAAGLVGNGTGWAWQNNLGYAFLHATNGGDYYTDAGVYDP